jgi:CHAT domain-containing protein
MRQAVIVHLACHGDFQLDNPPDSGLQLADGRLTLRDLLSVDLHALDAALYSWRPAAR